MKKWYWICSICLLFALSLGCTQKKEATLKVGATPVPHEELLNLIKEDLKKEGITLEIVEFNDYVTPNLALFDGEIDANFFQHKPYLEDFCKEHALNLVSLGGVHVEPLGLYAEKFKDAKDLPKGAQIAIPNDASNGGRALILLHQKGLLVLKDPENLLSTKEDILENPKEFKIIELEAAQIPRSLEDVDAAIINGNYALEAGFNPMEDALLLEGAESPYVNIVAVKEERKKDKDLLTLLNLLQGEKVQKYIESHYNGGVVHVNTQK